MVAFDLCAFIISLIMMGSVFVRYKKVDTIFFLLETLIVINCMGRFIMGISQSVNSALMANKILYIGGCYIPPLLVVILFRLCNLKLPRIATVIMTLYSTVVLALVMTIGYSDIYYKEVHLITTEHYSYLDKTYGPAHGLYPVMMALYIIFLIIFAIYIWRMRNRVPLRTTIAITLLGSVVLFTYILERILDSHISFMSVSYLASLFFLTRYFDRINMYDMTSNIVSAVEQRKEYGYIVFDKKIRFINANDYIKEIFPEINQWSVDTKVPKSDSLLCTEAVEYLINMQWSDTDNKTICVSDKYFELNINNITHGKKPIGYLIEFVDRTLEHKYYNSIENYNSELQIEVAAQTAHILHIKDMMVLGMADMVESRDNNTGGHIKRTSAVVKVFANMLTKNYSCELLSEAFLKMVVKAAPMHDLGKIAIDDNILRKPGKFTDEEYNEMKRHTTEGARIVENILKGVEDDEFVIIARNIALYHHEKWNGKGYPTGISGTEIPLEARIMALADVFDALVSKRCYKDSMPFDKAFDIITSELGEHFDPELGKIFILCREELEKIYTE